MLRFSLALDLIGGITGVLRSLNRFDLPGRRIGQDFPGIWRFAFVTNANATLSLVFSHATPLIVGSRLRPAKPETLMQPPSILRWRPWGATM
ncbi:hypothetical protein AA13594_0264 [Gluconacetobacter azotocaptans DSM 13594]|nr:hypothetical protein AA13594_0264 [Gluconacetobacter azotocaptans DSM 13594]